MEGLNIEAFDEEVDSLNLFGDEEPPKEEEKTETEEEPKGKETEEDNTADEDIDIDNMFPQESVGSGENNEDNAHPEGGGTSPDFFSSIATAFVEEGIFPDIQDEEIKNVKSAKDFRDLIDKQIKAGLDEQQKRVIEALDAGVRPSEIQVYEGWKKRLGSITDDAIKNEDNENLRKSIIFQDYINRGFSKERAEKMVLKSVEQGEDVEDAKESLKNLKDFYDSQYKAAVANADKSKKAEEEKVKETGKKIEESIMKSKFFNNYELDTDTKKKAYEVISKPIYKDENGRYYTALEKAELDDPNGFIAKLGILYAVTKGFTDLDNIGSKIAKKQIKKGFADLENKINNTTRDSNGRVKLANDTGSESYYGFKLAI